MPKQIHIRLDDRIHLSLLEYSRVTGKTIQDCITDALVQSFDDKYREKRRGTAKFTFIDLFAGIGGMRLAFEANGGQCVFSCEWDRYCQKTYFDNFGVMPYGDIRKIYEKDIPNHDILVAGFPCQPFSIAGVSKKNSLGRATGFLDKTQGTLFFEVVRILNEKRPRAFLLENVKNLKSHDKGRTWKIIMESLEKLDYEVFTDILDGQMFVPQHRERVFIVGFDRKRYGNDVTFDFNLQKPKNEPVLSNILEKRVDRKYTLSDHLWKYLQEYATKQKAKGNGFGYGLVDKKGITRTLSARYYKDGSEILIPQEGENPRRLTPRECARLQGYSDEYAITVSDTQAYKQFGNSVVVPLVTAVANMIVEKMEDMKEIDIRRENIG
ncbi:DNA (cytosine-5-)-methyltransferase [Caproiciproducens sp. R2]|uniref:DNA (cytosine-5-)-methyltransferase n=1 Tax=Caproiciproducens sp. R2 TaxID=3435187 RepID=UPI0040340EB4